MYLAIHHFILYSVKMYMSKDLCHCSLSTYQGDPDRVVANLRKRRGVAKATVSRLVTRVANLKGECDVPNTKNAAKQLLQVCMSLVHTEELNKLAAALDEPLRILPDYDSETLLNHAVDECRVIAKRLGRIYRSA